MGERKNQLKYIEKCREIIAGKSREHGRALTYCVTTFGCQMNARDSEKLRGILEEIGFEKGGEEDSDLVLFNTCTVRDNADRKVYGRLGRLKEIKRNHPGMIIGVCGCMTQEKTAAARVKDSYPFVDIIFGTHNVYALAQLLYEHLSKGERVISLLDEAKEIVESLPTDRKYGFKSGVNISYGCNNFCTYCIVPYVRGRERSRRASDILNEVKALAADGVMEIMLLGQNVNSYGQDFIKAGDSGVMSFPELLKRVSQVEGIERVRFMTSHPKDLSDELIEVIAENEKICSHVHLPLQSGSSRVLADMNRHYDKEGYLALVKKLRDRIEDVAITTDIIVGYPGETEEDVEDTMDVIRQAGFENAFTFQYSKRTGTPAAARQDQIPQDVVTRRFDRVLKLVQDTAADRAQRLTGRVLKVLADEKNEKQEDYISGKLDNGFTVHFKGDENLIGKIVNVRLDECHGFYYMGSIVVN